MITKQKGHYDWAHPHEQQWQVCLQLPDDAPKKELFQTWDLDDEPDIIDLPPSEVVEVIFKRLESYLISTRREQEREVIQWVRDNAERLDAEWAAEEIEAMERKIASLQARVESLRDGYGVPKSDPRIKTSKPTSGVS